MKYSGVKAKNDKVASTNGVSDIETVQCVNPTLTVGKYEILGDGTIIENKQNSIE